MSRLAVASPVTEIFETISKVRRKEAGLATVWAYAVAEACIAAGIDCLNGDGIFAMFVAGVSSLFPPKRWVCRKRRTAYIFDSQQLNGIYVVKQSQHVSREDKK